MNRRELLTAAAAFIALPYVDRVLKLLPQEEAPLVSLLRQSRPMTQRVEWLEDELTPRYTTLAADEGEIITVARGTGAYFRLGDVIRCEMTGENVVVTAIQNDTFAVSRGMGAIQATVGAPGDGLVKIANILGVQPNVLDLTA